MTPEEWDKRWCQIFEDALADLGGDRAWRAATKIANRETEEQFGPRPGGDE